MPDTFRSPVLGGCGLAGRDKCGMTPPPSTRLVYFFLKNLIWALSKVGPYGAADDVQDDENGGEAGSVAGRRLVR